MRGIERLVADESDTEMQEASAGSSYLEYNSPTLAESPDDFHPFDPWMCQKALNFMKNLHLGTGRDIEPREALILVAQAKGDDKLALQRYLFTKSPVIPRADVDISSLSTPPMWSNCRDDDGGIFPQPLERWQWPQAKGVETMGGHGEQRGKKRGTFPKLFGRGTVRQEASASPSERLRRTGFL